MSDDEKNIMIGDLLVRSGLISSADLTEAMQVSRRLGMPMGRVLTMDGRISPDIFQLALEAQSLIRDGIVQPDVGIEALGIAARDRQPIAEALKRMDRHPQASSGSTNRLGELLVDAHIITTDQLNQALKISVESGLPLGGTLVTQGIIHASLLPTVLRAQEQIRDGVLPRDAAIEELRAAMKIWAKAEAAMKRTDYAVEQPLRPSSVMSTLRDTLEGVAPNQSYGQQQHLHQTPEPMPMPMPMPVQPLPQHQPSSLHAQLQQQQQQQQYFQNQQQHQQPQAHPQTHPMQHQQTQPMQMPQHMQQPMPQQMQQPMPQHMQQQMPQHMQQMPQQMPQHMQQMPPQQMPQQVPQQVPTPIYGYNTPYGHAPYGGPAPDDPWGSWHGTVPRHHGLGVPLPGFPQPPAMPPEGYAPPPGYPPQAQHLPPQGAPPQQNWDSPPANMPQPQQQQPSSLHAQLQQQQQNQYQQPHTQPAATQPAVQYATPVSPTAAPPQPEVSQQKLQSAQQPSTPVALHDSAQPVGAEVAAPKPAQQEEEPSKDGAGQLKNAAAQLASRLGWAAPKGGDGDAQTDLPSPKKLSWTQPQPVAEAKVETPPQSPASEAVAQSKPESAAVPEPTQASPVPAPVPVPPPAPSTPPVAQTPVQPLAAPSSPVAETIEPLENGSKKPSVGNYKADWGSPSSVPSKVPEFKGPPSTPASVPFAAPQRISASPAAKETIPAEDSAPALSPPAIEAPAKSEIALELPAKEEKVEPDDDDDEPNFQLEMDLPLPGPFSKIPDKSIEVSEKESAAIVEAPRPGQVAGFGKGTKITLKSDYAPNETGRLFSITQADALTLLSDDSSFDLGEEKKEVTPSKGKKGKGKASQSQTKLTKQQAKGKKGQAAKSQTGLQSIKESEPLPSWLPQKHQTHPAATFGKKGGGGSVPDFIEDLVPAAKAGGEGNMQFGDLNQAGGVPGSKPSNTQSKMASIKQRAVSLSVANLLPVSIEIAEAQAELAYIVEHRGAPAVPPVSFTPQPPQPPQPETPATIVELLTLSGFFNKKDIASALDKALEDASLAPDLLMALGLVSDDTLDVAVRCQTLVRNRYLRTDQAIYVLGAVRSGRLSFEAALSEIGK